MLRFLCRYGVKFQGSAFDLKIRFPVNIHYLPSSEFNQLTLPAAEISILDYSNFIRLDHQNHKSNCIICQIAKPPMMNTITRYM